MTREVRKAPVVARLSRPWTSVPVDLMEEKSLSTTARLVLLYLIGLAGRPGWTIYVGQVCAALGLGEYAWTKARKQLEERGFYWSERRQESDGTWAWVHVVTDLPTGPSLNEDAHNHPPNPSIPGKPGDGSSGHGKPGDIRTKKAHTNKKSTTTAAAPTNELIYPDRLKDAEVVVVDGFISELPAAQQQEMLDELAGAMAKPGYIKSTPVSFLRSLVKRSSQGQFNPSLGIPVASARQQRVMQARDAAKSRAEQKRRRQAANSDTARRTAEASMALMREQLGIGTDRESHDAPRPKSAGGGS